MVQDIDHGWDKIKNEIKDLKDIVIEVGLFGNDEKNPKTNIAYRGIIQEYGAIIQVTNKMKGYFAAVFHVRKSDRPIVIPKRPFTAEAFDLNQSKLEKFVADEYDKTITGKQTTEKMIERIGVLHESQIKKSIQSGNWTPNSSMTSTIKGSSKPLIDKGEMLQNVTFKVKKAGVEK
jgi:hypothetical protein